MFIVGLGLTVEINMVYNESGCNEYYSITNVLNNFWIEK